MTTSFQPEIILQNLSPDVKSFIYQIILEFEPFTTPETVISVVAKNPLGLLSQTEELDENTTFAFDIFDLPKKRRLEKMYRIGITITESGNRIEAEGLHENIYEAIKSAKGQLLRTLDEIQDDVVSTQDRHIQIRQAMEEGNLH